MLKLNTCVSSSPSLLKGVASSNRIGALIALNFYDETGDAELALDMGRAAGMKSLEPLVRKMLGGDRAP